jgi:hypothetical protein
MTASTPIELELHCVFLTKSGAFRVDVRFDDLSYLTLDFEPGSDGHAQILDTLTRVLTRELSRIGERGIAIVGMTAVPDESEEDE